MWTDNTTDKDFLGFDVHANLIKELIRDEKMLPLTIGLFGDWGSGKSSILEVLKKEIEKEPKTACLYFNGWFFEGYDDAKAENTNDRIVNDYLEKLIQIPNNLPKLSDSEVETYVTLLFCENDLSPEDFDKVLEAFKKFREVERYSVFGFAKVKDAAGDVSKIEKLEQNVSLIAKLSPIIPESLYGNPRQIKRFLNTFMLRKKLATVAHIKDFRDDILAKLIETSYIGEVGLDFSREGFSTKEIQIKSFEFVLDCVKTKNKILSLHSRRAEKETLEMLMQKGIENAIFHWYSGSLKVLRNIAN